MSFANPYILDNCSLVRLREVTSGEAFAWLLNSLPFFVSDPPQLRIECPEEQRFYATRAEEHALIFISHMRFAHGAVSEVEACPVSRGSREGVDDVSSPSLPVPEPLHPAEASALSLFQSGRAPNAKDVN